MVRERESHVSRLFIEVTPGIRRALELLAEASITLLDEIDAPVDGLEADPDFEHLGEDDEEGGDHEPDLGWTTEGRVLGADDREPDLGWTNDGDGTGTDADDDFAAAESSAGFPRVTIGEWGPRAAVKAKFDPRLAARPQGGKGYGNPIPPFPHDPPGRPTFYVDEEIRRLNAALWSGRKRKALKRGKSNVF
jgi:hypothetical protein